jgi:hypothetical protein
MPADAIQLGISRLLKPFISVAGITQRVTVGHRIGKRKGEGWLITSTSSCACLFFHMHP